MTTHEECSRFENGYWYDDNDNRYQLTHGPGYNEKVWWCHEFDTSDEEEDSDDEIPGFTDIMFEGVKYTLGTIIGSGGRPEIYYIDDDTWGVGEWDGEKIIFSMEGQKAHDERKNKSE